MSIKSFISSYLPVQNTFETRIIQSLFSDGNIPTNTYFAQQNNFKLEFFDYVELEPTVDLSSYIEQSFYSSNSLYHYSFRVRIFKNFESNRIIW